VLDVLTEFKVAGNALWRPVLFCVTVLLALVLGKLLRMSLLRTAGVVETRRALLAVVLRALARAAVLLAFALGIWLSANGQTLILPAPAQSFFELAARALLTLGVGFTLFALTDIVDFLLGRVAARTASRVDDMLAPLVGKSVRITIAVLVGAELIQSFSDRPLTSLLAGLGVGGLALALAGQETIKNFFGSLMIVADRPFEIGDRIMVDGHDGPVEAVGLRSTKIRTLEGHLVTIPNGEIVSKNIQNIGRRPHIRRLADITITYDTAPATVARALAILREILHEHEGMHPDFPPRVYFTDFNDCSLNLRIIYWYHPPDYWNYLAFSERVNMQILERFNAEGIEFAFPTQTIHVAGNQLPASSPARPSKPMGLPASGKQETSAA
jgi:MscS family membrane protein